MRPCGVGNAVSFLSDSTAGKMAIFTNSRSRSFNYVRHLEKKLDEAGMELDVDVIHIHGSLLKAEKFWRVRLFCHSRESVDLDANFRAMVGTNAVNAGIDNNELNLVLRFEMARGLPTAFQEQGRGSRIRGQPSTYCLFTAWNHSST